MTIMRKGGWQRRCRWRQEGWQWWRRWWCLPGESATCAHPLPRPPHPGVSGQELPQERGEFFIDYFSSLTMQTKQRQIQKTTRKRQKTIDKGKDRTRVSEGFMIEVILFLDSFYDLALRHRKLGDFLFLMLKAALSRLRLLIKNFQDKMHYRARAIKEGQFKFANLASHLICIKIFQKNFPLILSLSLGWFWICFGCVFYLFCFLVGFLFFICFICFGWFWFVLVCFGFLAPLSERCSSGEVVQWSIPSHPSTCKFVCS